MAVSLATAALLCCTLFPAFPQPAAAHGFKHAADIDIKGTEDLTTG